MVKNPVETMRVVRYVINLLCAMAILASCAEAYDQLERDRNSIASFLASREYDVVDNVYRYVENSDRDGYQQAAVAQNGDLVEFYYEAYKFSTALDLTPGNYNVTYLFATNRPETFDFICDTVSMGDNPVWDRTEWPEDPIETTVGSGSLVQGVNIGLAGKREGDHVWMIFASDLGFGDQALGIVPKHQILAYRIYMEKVTKNR